MKFLKNPHKNYANHEKSKISYENHEVMKILIFRLRINKIIRIQIPCENY